MAKCSKCSEEINKTDQANGNWREYMGEYHHRWCPSSACPVCGEALGHAEAKRLPTSVSEYVHARCYEAGVRGMAQGLRQSEPEQANPSSWILKR